jgi:cytochrome c peroxidase
MQSRVKHFGLIAITLLISLAATATPQAFDLKIPLGLVPPKVPENNPLTQDKVELGKRLFFDQKLSLNGRMSCAICHVPEHGFADFLPFGFTVIGGNLARNTPTIINAALSDYQFWDGRASSLEGQVEAVYHRAADTSIDINDIVVKLRESPDYVVEFKKVFNSPPTKENLCQAIASYERTALSGDTRFDRYYYKDEPSALNLEEKIGLAVFMGKGNCNACHLVVKPTNANPGAALFIDQKFHNLGVGAYSFKRMKDGGRYLVTGDLKDIGKFKTPNLRNCELTSPYMHDGSLATLEDVVDFYDRGGNKNMNLDPLMKPLHLTEKEKKGLAAFLKTLTDEKLAKLYVPVPDLKKRMEQTLESE